MLLLTLCAGCARAAVESSGPLWGGTGAAPALCDAKERAEVDTAKRPKRSSAGLDLET